jgi:hypothetical protein
MRDHALGWFTRALLLFLLGCGSSDDAPSGDGASCEEQIDLYIARIAECLMVTAEQRQAAIDQCISGEPPPNAIGLDWRPEFLTEIKACGDTLNCEDYLEDFDDICFPRALAVLAEGILSPATITACIEGGTDDCAMHLQGQPETIPNVIGACFNKWAQCGVGLTNDAFWSEDDCGMLLALSDAQRAQAQACVDGACDGAAACLRDLGVVSF